MCRCATSAAADEVDAGAGEIGTIYQACGFHYVGVMLRRLDGSTLSGRNAFPPPRTSDAASVALPSSLHAGTGCPSRPVRRVALFRTTAPRDKYLEWIEDEDRAAHAVAVAEEDEDA